MSRRRAWLAGLVAASMLWTAIPARADTGSIDDPVGDVKDDADNTVADPALDITAVELTNEADRIEATVTTATMVPFDDPRWADGGIGLVVVLASPTDPDSLHTWLVFAFGGEPVGYLDDCETTVAQTATAYVLTADARCAATMPRSLGFGALMLSLAGDSFASDAAPDDDDLAPAVEAFGAAASARLAGTDRLLTAIELSRDAYPDDASASAVVLAASFSFPDALAGGPLAAYAGGPMLLTGADALDPRVLDEMERVLEPGGRVYVLGGTAALSDGVVADVRGAGFDPKRVAGVDRFATAIAIADEIGGNEIGLLHETVLVADGRTFTDALVAGAVAPGIFGVVVLTDGATMPQVTSDFLGNDDADHVAIGTPAATAASGLRRITGANPSELSVNVADELAPIVGAVAVASQATFADALAGGPHIAALGGPLLLTDPQTLSGATRGALEAAAGDLRQVVLYGGTAAISTAVESAIDAVLAS